MNRRDSLKLAAGAAAGAAAQPPAAIQLHVDLAVDPAHEKELVQNFRTIFRPAISRQPGFVDVKLLLLRSAVAGTAPAGPAYRLLISFQTEELRQKWVATDDHQRAWPSIQKTLRGPVSQALLYQVV